MATSYHISDTTLWRQDQALYSSAFIVEQLGPLAFIFKVEEGRKPVKVRFVGEISSILVIETCNHFI